MYQLVFCPKTRPWFLQFHTWRVISQKSLYFSEWLWIETKTCMMSINLCIMPLSWAISLRINVFKFVRFLVFCLPLAVDFIFVRWLLCVYQISLFAGGWISLNFPRVCVCTVFASMTTHAFCVTSTLMVLAVPHTYIV